MTQLLDGRKVEPYVMLVKINAELRKYQQEGVNWLAFLAKYQLHGILCDGEESSLLVPSQTLQTTVIYICRYGPWKDASVDMYIGKQTRRTRQEIRRNTVSRRNSPTVANRLPADAHWTLVLRDHKIRGKPSTYPLHRKLERAIKASLQAGHYGCCDYLIRSRSQ